MLGEKRTFRSYSHVIFNTLIHSAGYDSCYLALGAPCLQSLTTTNAHTKDQEGDLSKLSKDGEHGKPRAPSDTQSNIFVLRKMVEEVFTVLYSKESYNL